MRSDNLSSQACRAQRFRNELMREGGSRSKTGCLAAGRESGQIRRALRSGLGLKIGSGTHDGGPALARTGEADRWEEYVGSPPAA